MEELPAGGFGLQLEKFAPTLTPPLFDEDSPEDEGRRSSSTVAPNKPQSFTGGEEVVQAAAELKEKQAPIISPSFQDSNRFSTSDPEAYLEPIDSNSFNDEDSDDYFDSEELLKLLLSSKSDET